jgi:hypothetical protein
MALGDYGLGSGAGALGAAGIFAFLAAYLIFVLIIYLYTAIAQFYIAKKTKTDNAWLAFIPIANVYLLTQMAGVSGWWTLIVLASVIPFIGSLAVLVAGIWMFWKVAEEIGKEGWTSILLIMPIVNLVVLGYYAWSK